MASHTLDAMVLAFPIVLAVVAVMTLLSPAPQAEAEPPVVVDAQVVGQEPTPSETGTLPNVAEGLAGEEEAPPPGGAPEESGRAAEAPPPLEATEAPPAEQPPEGAPAEAPPVEQPPVSPPADEPPAALSSEPPSEPVIPIYFMPVEGVKVEDVWPSFGDPRGTDRSHQGIDIVAERGTPVRAAAPGVVWRIGDSRRGGLSVTIIGDDGARYFYTHLDGFAEGLEQEQRVGVDTVIGYVGNTGNAAATAPHLHFEVGLPVEGERYRWQPIDPLLYLLDR